MMTVRFLPPELAGRVEAMLAGWQEALARAEAVRVAAPEPAVQFGPRGSALPTSPLTAPPTIPPAASPATPPIALPSAPPQGPTGSIQDETLPPAGGELALLSIAQLAPLLRARQVSPVEVLEAVLARTAALEPRLNTYIQLTADSAREAARKAEAELARGEYRGPLHGVPLGLKDIFDQAGLPNTFGSRVLREYRPQTTATVVGRLLEQGAVLTGRQNLHEFAFGITTDNPHYGPTRNPWDPSRIPGGSSGGTAAAIAAGMAYGGLGTDTGGSVRIPAALCGVAGLKPTYGRVSRHGVLPLAWSLDHVGPLARTVADLALLLQAIAGPDSRDLTAAAVPVPDYPASLQGPEGARGLRVGVPRQFYFDNVHPGVAAAVRDAIDQLSRLGAEVIEVDLPRVAHAPAALTPIIAGEAATWHRKWLLERGDEYGLEVRTRLEAGLRLPATAYLQAQQIRAAIAADFAAAFARVDLLVAPTVAIPAPAIGTTTYTLDGVPQDVRLAINRLTGPANLAGLPALSVPWSRVEGLPVGVQIIGPAWSEPTLLRAAHALEAARGPWEAPAL